MAVPQVDLLPDPPLPTDAEDVFDAKAGVSLTAQQAMVPQINTALNFINDTAVDANAAIAASVTALAAKDAALASANNASASATAAESAQGSIGNLALIHSLTIGMMRRF